MQIKSYSFYCKDLNKGKYDLLLKKAIELNDLKNQVSQEVCKDFQTFAEMGKYDWVKYFRSKIQWCNNQDVGCSIMDVYTAYENKIQKLKENLEFKSQLNIKYSYYKNNGKTYYKGEVRSAELIFGHTNFSKCLTFLARHWNDNLITWIESKIKEDPSSKTDLFREIIKLYKKYPERMKSLILSTRERLAKKLTEHPIQFKELTYRSCNELKDPLLNRNKNEHSLFGAVIVLGGQKTEDGRIEIPVKWNEKHHGEIKEYDKESNSKNRKTVPYTICFYPTKQKIRIVLTRECADDVDVVGNVGYYGVDVNIKHNLFSDKFGSTIDYDRKLFNDYVLFLKEMDRKSTRKKDLNLDKELSLKDRFAQKKWQTRIKDMLKRKSRQLLEHMVSLGKNHIVLEDLSQFAKSFIRSDEFEGFKYSRLVRMLNLGSLKQIIKSIGTKMGIQVSFVPAQYTSQECPKCHHISRDNRKSQENFSCSECGFSASADQVSPKNIESRIAEDVLREKLLLFKDNMFQHKNLKNNQILAILYDHYSKKEIDNNFQLC
jgi:IS605 OrfB family transposase